MRQREQAWLAMVALALLAGVACSDEGGQQQAPDDPSPDPGVTVVVDEGDPQRGSLHADVVVEGEEVLLVIVPERLGESTAGVQFSLSVDGSLGLGEPRTRTGLMTFANEGSEGELRVLMFSYTGATFGAETSQVVAFPLDLSGLDSGESVSVSVQKTVVSTDKGEGVDAVERVTTLTRD